jgi:hypothetical protein
LSDRAINVSAVARGIAEADSVGIAANAHAAKPISNKRFILGFSLEGPLDRGKETMFPKLLSSTGAFIIEKNAYL